MEKYISYGFVKKFNIICLCILLMCLSACTQVDVAENNGRLSVVTVNFTQYDFARAICADKADVTMIIRPGAEVHGYEPSFSDIVAIENADVFIYNGGESDVWVKRVLSSVNTKGMTVIPLMKKDGITLYEEEGFILHEHTDGHDVHHAGHNHKEGAKAYDEHIWTSPKNALAIADIICEAVVGCDGKNSEFYKENTNKLKDELNKLDKNLTETVRNAPKNLIVVADRFPFLYMAKDYGLQYMAAFSGCSPESDAGPSVIASMIDEIEIHSIDSVFNIEMSNGKMADVVCEHTGTKKLLLHSCQNVTGSEFESGATYCSLMKQNIINLKEALYQ